MQPERKVRLYKRKIEAFIRGGEAAADCETELIVLRWMLGEIADPPDLDEAAIEALEREVARETADQEKATPGPAPAGRPMPTIPPPTEADLKLDLAGCWVPGDVFAFPDDESADEFIRGLIRRLAAAEAEREKDRAACFAAGVRLGEVEKDRDRLLAAAKVCIGRVLSTGDKPTLTELAALCEAVAGR